MQATALVAVDVGNARIKLGLFAGGCAAGIAEPLRTLPLGGDAPELEQITPWLAEEARDELAWWIASVNRSAATGVIDWLSAHRPRDRITLLAAGDLPLEVRLERPDMVGIDRLVDAVAVNRLRDAGRAAVIVDVGTAITVDLVSARRCCTARLPGKSALVTTAISGRLPRAASCNSNSPRMTR